MGTLIDVPAPIFSRQFCLQWDVANPRTAMPFPNHLFSTSRAALVAIGIYLYIYFRHLGHGLWSIRWYLVDFDLMTFMAAIVFLEYLILINLGSDFCLFLSNLHVKGFSS